MKISLKRRIAGRRTWDRMRVNFLFIPGIMALIAVFLAFFIFWLDNQIPNDIRKGIEPRYSPHYSTVALLLVSPLHHPN